MWTTGLWRNSGPGYFGEPQEWSWAPLAYAPNPTECVWVGPNVADVDCSTCTLGYETTSASNNTCVQPEFRPHSGWEGSSGQAQLQLQDTHGAVLKSTGAATPVLLTGHTYIVQAPTLEPKERKFVGYAQPFVKIRYELDFSRGAEVDIGCGTAVVGDGSVDKDIPRNQIGLAHPLSMNTVSYMEGIGRANPKAGNTGYYPQRCPRYHRFKVIRAGNFTFVRVPSCQSVRAPQHDGQGCTSAGCAERRPLELVNHALTAHGRGVAGCPSLPRTRVLRRWH